MFSSDVKEIFVWFVVLLTCALFYYTQESKEKSIKGAFKNLWKAKMEEHERIQGHFFQTFGGKAVFFFVVFPVLVIVIAIMEGDIDLPSLIQKITSIFQ
jgi:hypothetical protein